MKKILLKSVQLLPEFIQGWLYRRLVRLSYELDSDYSISIAETEEEYLDAFTIVYQSYLDKGYMDENECHKRVSIHHASPSTSIIVLKFKNEVIGTVSLFSKSNKKLPIQDLVELPDFILESTYCEVSSLAIKQGFRSKKGLLLLPLLKFLYNYTVTYMKVDYLLINVNPSAYNFYKLFLLFTQLKGAKKKNERVKGAPAVSLYYELDMVDTQFRQVYGKLPDERNMFRYLTELEMPNLKYPNRYYYNTANPVKSPEFMKMVFDEETGLLSSLSTRPMMQILEELSDERFEKMIYKYKPKLKGNNTRRELRFNVSCPVLILDGTQKDEDVEAVNASERGLRIQFDRTTPLERGETFQVKIRISDFDVVNLKLRSVAKIDDKTYGLEILESSDGWSEFINYLNGRGSGYSDEFEMAV